MVTGSERGNEIPCSEEAEDKLGDEPAEPPEEDVGVSSVLQAARLSARAPVNNSDNILFVFFMVCTSLLPIVSKSQNITNSAVCNMFVWLLALLHGIYTKFNIHYLLFRA